MTGKLALQIILVAAMLGVAFSMLLRSDFKAGPSQILPLVIEEVQVFDEQNS